MTYYGGKEMAASFRTVRDNTVKIAEEIPESQYEFKPAPDCRSIGQTLVHIALGPGFALYLHGNKVTDLKQVNFGQLMQQASADVQKGNSRGQGLAARLSTARRLAQGLAEPSERIQSFKSSNRLFTATFKSSNR